MNSWEILWEKEAEEDLNRIDRNTVKKIKEKVVNVLLRNPKFGKPLTGEWKGCYRITFGNYRIIYELHKTQLIILVVKAEHRSSVYEGKIRRSTFFVKQSTTTKRPPSPKPKKKG